METTTFDNVPPNQDVDNNRTEGSPGPYRSFMFNDFDDDHEGEGESGHRIVGGEPVKRHTMPWQVSLVSKRRRSNRNTCGGSVLCPKYILTAGHCTENSKPSRIQVLVGAHKLNGRERSQKRYDVRRFHDHPKYYSYDGQYSDYDYSILELKQSIKMIPEVRAVYLPSSSDTKFSSKRTKFIVSGWGRLKSGGDLPQQLMSVTVPYVSDKECKRLYRYPKGGIQFKISSRMICAGDVAKGGIDACQGDSGGPLVWLDDGKVKVVGVVSFGFSCADADSPGVYAKTTYVLNWIRKIAGRCHDSAIKKGLGMTKDKLDPDVIQRFKTISNPQPQSPIFLPSHWGFWEDYHRENFNKEIEDSFNDVFHKSHSRG